MMNKTSIVLSLVVLVFVLALSSYAKAESVHPFVDKTVAGITLGMDDFSKIKKIYGKGMYYAAPEGDSQTLCYYFKPVDTYLLAFAQGGKESDVMRIGLLKGDSGKDYRYSSYERCKESPEKVSLKSGKGVSLGMSPQELKKIYGKPAKENGFDNYLFLEYHTNSDEDTSVELAYDSEYKFVNNKLVEFYVYEGE